MARQTPPYDSQHPQTDTEDLFEPWFRAIAMDAAGDMLDMMACDIVPEALSDLQHFLALIPRRWKARHDLLEGVVQAVRILIIRNAAAIRADYSHLLEFSGLRELLEDTVWELWGFASASVDPDELKSAQAFVAWFLERLVLHAARAALEERAPLVADKLGAQLVHVSLRVPVADRVAGLVTTDSEER